MCCLYTIRDKAKCVTWPSGCYLFSFIISSATHVLQQLLSFMPFSKAVSSASVSQASETVNVPSSLRLILMLSTIGLSFLCSLWNVSCGSGRTRTCGVSLTVTDLQSAPFAARGTDPYNYGHHTGVIINVWWPLAEVNNQPRVVTRNTSVLALVSSEWRDSNPRPPAPKAGALPSCATFRVAGLLFRPQITSVNVMSPKSKPDAVSR